MAESSAASVSDALKRLSKTLALGLPVVLLRASCVILSFGIVNLAFAVWVFIYSGMGGNGHAGIVALPLASVPFLPFFVLALLMAHKQGVASVIALAVESQGPTLAAVGEHTMATYLEQNKGALLRESPHDPALLQAHGGSATRWFLCSIEPIPQPEARRVGLWKGPIWRPSIDPPRRTRPDRSMPLPG